MKHLIFLLAILSSLSAHSGYERGNGGNFLLCGPKSALGEGVFSLDRVEGERTYRRSSPSYLKEEMDENEIVDFILQKIEKVNPSRATMYQIWYKEMLEKRVFVDGMKIHPLNDGDVVFIPGDCSLRQGAVFTADPMQKNVHFYFDRDLWNSAAPLDRAYLMLHELVYREARLVENDHVNSMASRNLTGWLFLHIDELSQESMIQKIEEVAFRLVDYNGMALSLTLYGRNKHYKAPLLRYPDSRRIWKAVLYHSFKVDLKDQGVFQRRCPSEPNEHGLFSDWVEFYPSGAVKGVYFSESLYTNAPDCSYFKGNNVLRFNQEGQLKKASFEDLSIMLDFTP